MSYLRLMKSIWLVDRIRESQDWAKTQRTSPGGFYDRCVREMDRRLRVQCSQAVRTPAVHSRLLFILQLPDETFAIWPQVVSPKNSAQVTYLGVLLGMPVLPNETSHTLCIVRNIDTTLGTEDTNTTMTESAGTNSSDRVVQKFNIDLGKVYLVPIYAILNHLGSNDPSSIVKLQSSPDGINGVTVEFSSTSDLLKLQHLITGYRCVKRSTYLSKPTLWSHQADRVIGRSSQSVRSSRGRSISKSGTNLPLDQGGRPKY
jgi:hypothetical protein